MIDARFLSNKFVKLIQMYADRTQDGWVEKELLRDAKEIRDKYAYGGLDE